MSRSELNSKIQKLSQLWGVGALPRLPVVPMAVLALLLLHQVFPAETALVRLPQQAACPSEPLTIEGTSMLPRLAPGQSVDIEWRRPPCGLIQRGEVVVFRVATEPLLQAKRLVALAGDLVTITPRGELMVNDTIHENSRGQAYLLSPPQWKVLASHLDEDSQVPPGHHIVLGESINLALDSRLFGLVADDDILAKVLSNE